MFVSYTPLDAIGTEVGLMLLTKEVDSIWHGNFFGAALLSIVVFLSLAKIAMDGIIEHKYETAIFEFARLSIVAAFFAVTGSVTIFSMNVINFSYAWQAAQNGDTVVGDILNFVGKEINKVTGNNVTGYTYNISNPTSASIQAYGVPLMAEIYAIPSDLAYQISSIMLNPQKNATIDVSKMVLNPSDLLYTALVSWIKASPEPGAIYKSFAKCYTPQSYKNLNLSGKTMSCNEFNQTWGQYAQNIVNQIKQQGNVSKNALFPDENNIALLEDGRFQPNQNNSTLLKEYLGKEMALIDQNAKATQQLEATMSATQGTQPDTSPSNEGLNNVQQAASKVITTITLALSTVLSLKGFLEDMMMTVQEYAIAAMFILLPLVVVVGLLPIFGNNYKLILKYAFSFFLIKLWIPLYWFVYVAMVNVSAILMSSATPIHNGLHFIHYGIQYAITTFVGQSAYASGITYSTPGFPQSASGQQIVSIANAMAAASVANKFSAFNNIILSFFAFAIPSVLGSSATFLVGRGMMEAGAAAAAESLLFTKKLFFAAGKMATQVAAKGLKAGAGAAWKGAKAAPGAIKAAPGAIRNAPDKVRDFWKDRQITKDLYGSKSVGSSAKALGVKMKKSTTENITKAIGRGNVLVQDKEGGVSAYYDKNFNLRGIREKDGTFLTASELSAEERAQYALDVDRGFGVINTKTGDFVSAGFNRQADVVPRGVYGGGVYEDRIGKIKDKEMLAQLNKMLK